MVSSIRQIDAAAAPNTPAAVWTTASIRPRDASGLSIETASDTPVSVRSGAPSALANAATDATRRSGIISRPAETVRSSSGVTSGLMLDSLVGSAYTGGRPGDQRPQRGSDAEHVGPRGHVAAGEHLGGHEPRRADPDGALLLDLVEQAGDPEVDEHDAVLAQDQVLGLDVAVDDLLVVHVLERLARLARVLDRLVQGKARLAALLEQHAEVDPADEVHHQVLARRRREVVRDAHHPRVLEAGQQPRLGLEPLVVMGVGALLERDLGVGLGIDRAVDLAHRPSRNRLEDPVPVLQCSPQNLRGRSWLVHAIKRRQHSTLFLPHPFYPLAV